MIVVTEERLREAAPVDLLDTPEGEEALRCIAANIARDIDEMVLASFATGAKL